MSKKALRVTVQQIESLQDDSLYIHLQLTANLNDRFKQMVIRQPTMRSARFLVHPQTLCTSSLIVKLAPQFNYEEAACQLIKTLKQWHEIECGWLNCLQPLYISVHNSYIPTQLFKPDELSMNLLLGHITACKDWAMINHNWLVMLSQAKQEYWLKRQLV
jgi:hypothetical protein